MSDKHELVEEWVDARSFCYGVMSGIETFSEIEELLEPTLQDLGFELVVARILGGGRRTLQVLAEPADAERGMTIDDCAEISHAISAVLDVADPIPGQYTLEVSSPGLDRPLVRKSDFERFRGRQARIETDEPLDGRKRFRGELLGLTEGTERLRLRLEEGDLEVSLSSIRKARLEISDDLIKASARTNSGEAGSGKAGAHKPDASDAKLSRGESGR